MHQPYSQRKFQIYSKDFIYLGLDKKKLKKLWASLDGFIKAVSFIIYFHCFFLSITTKLSLLLFFFFFYPYQAWPTTIVFRSLSLPTDF